MSGDGNALSDSKVLARYLQGQGKPHLRPSVHQMGSVEEQDSDDSG